LCARTPARNRTVSLPNPSKPMAATLARLTLILRRPWSRFMGTRAINAFLGPHPLPQLINAWMCGIFSVTIALAAIELDERARYLNVALGLWLIVSSLIWRS